jgi:TolB-like protein
MIPVSRFRTYVLAIAVMTACAGAVAAQGSAESAIHAAVVSEHALNGRVTARRTIAVLPFTVTAPDTSLLSLGFGLAEFLADDLAHSHRLMMVERGRLNELQHEVQLTATGIVDPSTAVRVGRLVTARTLVIGAINATDAGRLTIDARAVDVETAAIDMHRTESSPLESIFRAERDLVMETFAAFDITLTPDEKSLLYERVAPQFRAFLSFSRGVRAENQGNDELAAASYQDAASRDRTFTLAAAKLAAVRARITRTAATTTAEKDEARSSAGEPAKESTKESEAMEAKVKATEATLTGGSAPGGSLTSGSAHKDAIAATPAKTDTDASISTPPKTTSKGRKHFVPKPSPH